MGEYRRGLREIGSGEYRIERDECSLTTAYARHPGRWSSATFRAATKVPGVFDGNITPLEAEDVLDSVARVLRLLDRSEPGVF